MINDGDILDEVYLWDVINLNGYSIEPVHIIANNKLHSSRKMSKYMSLLHDGLSCRYRWTVIRPCFEMEG